MIVLTGEPKSTNNIYRYACRGNYPSMYMTKTGKDIKKQYQWEAKSQWKMNPLKGELTVNVILYFGTKRTHDIDNYSKILLDSLTDIVWEDDKQITELNIVKEYDKERPRIEVTVL